MVHIKLEYLPTIVDTHYECSFIVDDNQKFTIRLPCDATKAEVVQKLLETASQMTANSD